MNEPLYRLRCEMLEVGETADAEGEHTSSCYEVVEIDMELLDRLLYPNMTAVGLLRALGIGDDDD